MKNKINTELKTKILEKLGWDFTGQEDEYLVFAINFNNFKEIDLEKTIKIIEKGYIEKLSWLNDETYEEQSYLYLKIKVEEEEEEN